MKPGPKPGPVVLLRNGPEPCRQYKVVSGAEEQGHAGRRGADRKRLPFNWSTCEQRGGHGALS